MSDAIEVNKGECVRAEVRWADEGGPIDLSGRDLLITEAYPPELVAGTVTATDAPNGTAELFLPESLASQLGAGRVNWVRLGMRLPDGCLDTTPRIWIAVA